MADPPLLQMPLHLLSIMLAQLDSMPSLVSAIFSHSSFYAAFNEDRDRIVRQIITSQISPGILNYAMRTHAASLWEPDRCSRRGLEQIRDFLFDHPVDTDFCDTEPQDQTFARPGSIDLRLAAALSRTHATVEFFTNDFLRDTLPLVRQELGLRRRNLTAATKTEVFRIHRAIYRFQLYCDLVRHPFTREEERDHLWPILFSNYFSNFSPWVNEQLASVCEYFDRVLSRAYNDFAAHDVQWGSESANWLAPCRRNWHKQAYLFSGLRFLYRAHQARTYNQQREIFQREGNRHSEMKYTFYSELSAGSTLVDLQEWRWWWSKLSEYLVSGDHKSITKWWTYNGPDVYGSGPFRMWHASHKATWRHRPVLYYETHTWLRRCGYVMWDNPETPISDEELEERVSMARNLSLLDHFRRKDGDLKGKMKKSWRERREIYARGGRGYWSNGDLSQIVWTNGSQGMPTETCSA